MIGYSLKMFISPKFTTATSVVNPKITPHICGIVFIIPKLNAEYEATILFGPGEQLVTNINNDIDNNSGCILFKLLVNRFQLFAMDELK